MDKYFFYNGFGPPEEIESIEEFGLESNYKGDVSDDMMELHEVFKDDQDIDYNLHMWEYNIIRNPGVEDFRRINESFGLDKDEYLDEILR